MTATDDIEFNIARLDLRPGDILVVKLKDRVNTAALTHWREGLGHILPDNKCMILEGGADLAVLTAAEIAERAK